jgi:predicted metal-dependent phosphoesterase TrpH
MFDPFQLKSLTGRGIMTSSKRKPATKLAGYFLIIMLLSLAIAVPGQIGTRKELKVPDILGFVTLKCDFHMHTVFSDGLVWPEVRVEEMWCEGYDAFSITDHVEYHPFSEDVSTDLNRSYELAKPDAEALGLLLIRGAEITRMKPPGHFNTLFLSDANLLNVEDFKEAMRAAHDQGAFIIWNHPGWPDDKEEWYPIHTELYEEGLLQGIEVVNGDTYYPSAHRWALEKKLTMFGNSDIHVPTAMEYDIAAGRHKPVTLVFAKERTAEAIKEALLARRTVVWSIDNLIGEEQYLRPIFDAAVEILTGEVELHGLHHSPIQIRNTCDVPFKLELVEGDDSLRVPAQFILYPDRTIRLSVRAAGAELSGEKEVEIRYRVTNLLIAPNEGMQVAFKLRVKFLSSTN